jgi:surfeit locus 1 family protein
MKLTIANMEFLFSFFTLGLYSTFMVLLVSLGFWQLDRADEKKVFLKKQQLSAQKTVLKLTADADLNTVRYRKTEITGYYDDRHQYLIDNQIVSGRAGYFVMTPFNISGMDLSVLVNRGWVVLNKDRRILPDVSVNGSKRTITGRINHFPVVGIRLAGAEIPTEGWPAVVQVVDSELLAKKLGYPLLPFQIELDSTMSEGYYRDWKKNTIMPPEKHVAYAVQWFGLALTLTVLFIGFSRKSK